MIFTLGTKVLVSISNMIFTTGTTMIVITGALLLPHYFPHPRLW